MGGKMVFFSTMALWIHMDIGGYQFRKFMLKGVMDLDRYFMALENRHLAVYLDC